ncbi:hypothetical protein BDZ89DRAFT_1085410, partial [Hymenopellis radicata]
MPDCQKDPGPAVERPRTTCHSLPLFWAPQNIAYRFRSLQTGSCSISRGAKKSTERTCPLWEIDPKFFSSFLPLHLPS